MYAKITKDHLDLGDVLSDWKPRDGQVIIDRSSPPHSHDIERLEVRLLDDDRELYYEAVATDDALEDLFMWAQRDAGVTILQVKKGNAWVDEIS